MKKISILIMTVAIVLSSSLLVGKHASAQDVWITETTEYEYYVMTESIQTDGKSYCTCETKNVKNGELEHIETWRFDCPTGKWRYWTSNMAGNRFPVVRKGSLADQILQGCLSL